jgi:chemotaxis protein MotB
MQTTNTKTILLIAALISAVYLLAGCTNWEKKYQALNVENENLKGQLEHERAEKGQLAEQVTKGQHTIEELQKKIAEQKQSPAAASGFGPGYDVAFNAESGTVTITLPTTVLFDSGKATLKKASSTQLNHIASILKSQYAGRSIDVVGHTDSQPIKKSQWKDNWQLSTERANAVVRYLIERGVPKGSMRASGLGDSKPVASNATPASRAKNRRVEIVVHMR